MVLVPVHGVVSTQRAVEGIGVSVEIRHEQGWEAWLSRGHVHASIVSAATSSGKRALYRMVAYFEANGCRRLVARVPLGDRRAGHERPYRCAFRGSCGRARPYRQ